MSILSGNNKQRCGLHLRATLACAFVLTAVYFQSHAVVAALTPLLLAALSGVASDFHILSLALVQEGPDTALEARAMLEHVIILGGRAIVPNGTTGYAVTTTAGTVLQPLMAAAIFVLAWPGRWIELALRIALTIPLLLLALLVDAPMYLAGSLWDMQVRIHEPNRFSPLVWWMSFLVNGGRIMLGFVAASLAIALSALVVRKRTG